MLKIERLICGMLESNCYVIYHEDGGQCYVIDPGYGARAISDVIRAHSLKPKAILLTHHHYDHVGESKSSGTNFRVRCIFTGLIVICTGSRWIFIWKMVISSILKES